MQWQRLLGLSCFSELQSDPCLCGPTLLPLVWRASVNSLLSLSHTLDLEMQEDGCRELCRELKQQAPKSTQCCHFADVGILEDFQDVRSLITIPRQNSTLHGHVWSCLVSKETRRSLPGAESHSCTRHARTRGASCTPPIPSHAHWLLDSHLTAPVPAYGHAWTR